MAKVNDRACRYVACGQTDEAVLADLDSHIRQNHPRMVGKCEPQQLLDLIEEV